MCAPAVAVGLASTAISAGFQIASTVRANNAASQQAAANARLAGFQSADVTRQGAEQAAAIERSGRAAGAAALAAVGSNNVESTTGSVANMFAVGQANAAADAARARANAARAAWGVDQEQQDLLAQAQNARRRGFLSATQIGLEGLSQAGGRVAGYYLGTE
jgi:hypothetical protein